MVSKRPPDSNDPGNAGGRFLGAMQRTQRCATEASSSRRRLPGHVIFRGFWGACWDDVYSDSRFRPVHNQHLGTAHALISRGSVLREPGLKTNLARTFAALNA